MRILLIIMITLLAAACSVISPQKAIDKIEDTTAEQKMDFSVNDLNFSLLDETGAAQTMSYYSKYDVIIVTAYSPSCDKSQMTNENIHYAKGIQAKVFHIITGINPVREPALYNKKIFPLLFDRTDAISKSFNFKNAGDYVILNPTDMQVMNQGNLKNTKLSIKKNPRGEIQFSKTKNASAAESLCEIKYAPITDFSDVGKSISKSCLFCHLTKDSIELFNSQEQVNHWQPMMKTTMRMGRMPAQADNELLPLFYNSTPSDLKKISYWLASGAKMTYQISKDITDDKKKYSDYLKEMKLYLGKPLFVLQAPTENIPAKGLGYERLYKFNEIINDDLYVYATNLETNLKTTHHAHLHATIDEIPDSIFQDDKSGAMSVASTWGIDKKPASTNINGKKVKGFVLNDQTVSSHFKKSGFRFDPGYVTKIPKGSKLSIEVHYDPTGVETTDNLKMEVYTVKGPFKNNHILKKLTLLPDFKAFKIKPHQKNYKVVMSYLTDKEIYLYSYLIHVHYRGKSAKLKVIYPGEKKEQTLISFPRIQFKMYQGGRFEKSIRLPIGTKIISEVIYDNSEDHEANPDPTKEIVLGRSAHFNESHLPRLFYFEENND